MSLSGVHLFTFVLGYVLSVVHFFFFTGSHYVNPLQGDKGILLSQFVSPIQYVSSVICH